MTYCAPPFSYQRRTTREMRVGHVAVGGARPIRVQSIITSQGKPTPEAVKTASRLAIADATRRDIFHP